jgi:hypothetical protein
MVQIRKEQITLRSAHWSEITYSGTNGFAYTDIIESTFLNASATKINGGDPSTSPPTRGIIIDSLENFVQLTDVNSNLAIIDNANRVTYGRLTYNSGFYRITYYALVAGVEVATTLPDDLSIRALFPEVMELSEVPTDTNLNLSPLGGAGGNGVLLTNDLGGIITAPTVVGIQNRQVNSTEPEDGYSLVWSTLDNCWKPASAISQQFISQTVTSSSVINLTARGLELLILVDTSNISWLNGSIITLPIYPASNSIINIKDKGGQASTKRIDILGNSYNIDSLNYDSININYGARRLFFDGTRWYNI